MTMREMNLKVFKGEEIPHVFFQPRLEPWHSWHKDFGKLPKKYAGMDLREFYDELGVSMRYVHYYTGMPNPVETRYTEKVKVEGKRVKVNIPVLPHGALRKDVI